MAENLDRNIWLSDSCIISSLGSDTKDNFAAMKKGLSGLKYSVQYNAVLGEITDDILSDFHFSGCSRLEALIIKAVNKSISFGRFTKDDVSDMQIILATTKGDVEYLQSENNPDSKVYLWNLADRIAKYFHSRRKALVVSNACISGLSATIIGSRMIRERECDNVLLIAGDLLSEFIVEGFRSFKSLSEKPCKPYDKNRDGLCLGEGVAALILTSSKEKAQEPYIQLLGGSISNDANHISGPSRTGDGLFYAIEQAVKESQISYEDIALINTHGTATLYNDEMESKALNLAGLCNVPINGLKGFLGHTLGASSLIEIILCAEQMRNSLILATKGYEECGTPYKLNISQENRKSSIPICLKTASGFGGCNAAIVLSTMCYPSVPENGKVNKVFETFRCELSRTDLEFNDFIKQEYKKLSVPNMKFFKMDNMCKAGYVVAENLLKESNLTQRYSKNEIGIVLHNKVSSLDSDIKHKQVLDNLTELGASPSIFVYTLPNVVCGEICIRHKIMGENIFFVSNENTLMIRNIAESMIRDGRVKALIYGVIDVLGEDYNVKLCILETINSK